MRRSINPAISNAVRAHRAVGASVAAAAIALSPAVAQPCDEFLTVASPNAGTDANFLFGAAALSAHDAWAVGHYRSASFALPLSLHWNGAAWTIVPMPTPPSSGAGPQASLYDVHAFGPNEAWAVGSNPPPTSTALETLAYRWDGTEWSIVPSPAGCCGAFGSSFFSVDGAAADDFWAVGFMNIEGPNAPPLAAHWNGATWDSEVLPLQGNARVQSLKDLHVIGSDDIWALEGVGLNVPNSPRRVFHWNGSSWSQTTTELDALRYGAAEAIFAFGPDDVWVSSILDSTFAPVMLHWDGSTWTESIVPVFASEFFGDAPDDLYAVGSTSIMRWNGAQWTVVASIAGAPPLGNCFDAEMAPDGTLWSAGTTGPGAAAQTLTATFLRCSDSRPADIDGDGIVGIADLLLLLADWGACAGCPSDIDGDGMVGLADLLQVLAAWT